MKVKLAAKLLIIAWTLMKKKEPFDPRQVRGEFPSLAAGDGRES